MAYDLEEQERLDELKEFWRKYGNAISTAITIAALAVAGWRGWGWYQDRQATQAAGLYHELGKAIAGKQPERVKSAVDTVFGDYGGTVYAPLAGLAAAHADAEAGDRAAARARLEWTVAHADDPGMREAARLSLASALIDDKAYDAAARVLGDPVDPAFVALFADRRGDLALAQGQRDDARKAYEAALEKVGAASTLHRLVRLKLDALAGEGK